MGLNTVIANLENTIAGKEHLLKTLQERIAIQRDAADRIAMIASVEFLDLNINELKRILNDLRKCVHLTS